MGKMRLFDSIRMKDLDVSKGLEILDGPRFDLLSIDLL